MHNKPMTFSRGIVERLGPLACAISHHSQAARALPSVARAAGYHTTSSATVAANYVLKIRGTPSDLAGFSEYYVEVCMQTRLVYCALVASVSAFALQSGSVLPVRSSGSQPRRSSLTMAGNQMHAGTLGGPWTNDEIFAGALPKVVAFDLDATLWYPEMYQVRMRNLWNKNTHVNALLKSA